MNEANLNQHLDLIYSTIDHEARWQHCLQAIAEDVDACSGMIGVDDLHTGHHLERMQVGYDPELITLVQTDLKKHDIWTQALVKKPHQGFRTTEELVPLKQLVRSDFYNHGLKRFDIEFGIGAYAHTQGRFGTRLAFQRRKQQGEFSTAQQGYLNFLLPHFQRAIALQAQLSPEQLRPKQLPPTPISQAARQPYQGAGNVISSQNFLLICNAKQEIIYANPELEQAIDQLPIEACFAQQIIKLKGLTQSKLAAALASVCRLDQLTDLATPIRFQLNYKAQRFSLSIDRIVLNETLKKQLYAYKACPPEHNKPLALLNLRLKAQRPRLSIMQLSGREQDLSTYIAKGLSPREIAEHERRSPQTVTSQIKQIRQKLGHKTYTSLVAQLSQAQHLLGQTFDNY